jgi:hypothetical protein
VQAPATTAAQSAAPAQPESNLEKTMVSSGLDRIKAHIERIARAIPDLPNQAARAKNITMQELSDREAVRQLLLFAVFIAARYALMEVVYRLTRPFRLWLIASEGYATRRAKKISSRLLYSAMLVAAYAIGSAGAFMLFEWPPLLRANRADLVECRDRYMGGACAYHSSIHAGSILHAGRTCRGSSRAADQQRAAPTIGRAGFHHHRLGDVRGGNIHVPILNFTHMTAYWRFHSRAMSSYLR